MCQDLTNDKKVQEKNRLEMRPLSDYRLFDHVFRVYVCMVYSVHCIRKTT